MLKQAMDFKKVVMGPKQKKPSMKAGVTSGIGAAFKAKAPNMLGMEPTSNMDIKGLQKEAPETLKAPKRADFDTQQNYMKAMNKFKLRGRWDS